MFTYHNQPLNIKYIYQYDLDGNMIAKFTNPTRASEVTLTPLCGIRDCLNSKAKSCNNYQWSYNNTCEPYNITPHIVKTTSVVAFKDGQPYKEFESIKDAAKYINRTTALISACLKGKKPTAGGFTWQYNN